MMPDFTLSRRQKWRIKWIWTPMIILGIIGLVYGLGFAG